MSNGLYGNLNPSAIITFYKNDQGSQYAEINLITEKNGLLPARPLAMNDIKEFISHFKSKIKEKEERTHWWESSIPENVVTAYVIDNKSVLVWISSEKTKKISFTKETGLKSVTATFPDTLFVAVNNQLSVYCIGHYDDVPKLPLYESIYPNTMAKGEVCFGNIEIDIPQTCSFDHLMKTWENHYWNSLFTDAHVSDQLKKEYKRLSREKDLYFNADLLKPCKEYKTIKDLLNALKE